MTAAQNTGTIGKHWLVRANIYDIVYNSFTSLLCIYLRGLNFKLQLYTQKYIKILCYVYTPVHRDSLQAVLVS